MEPSGPGRVERRLAAILTADVVGYSRLIEADEEGTLVGSRRCVAEVIDPKTAGHKGRLVKTTGDGLRIEFASVVDAVRCAAEVQAALGESNAPLPPDRRIEFRIGVHLGDVVEESDGDLMGDGVNIAARLEGVAQPGAICLSEDAYRQVRSRLDLVISDLGETRLKNIAEPMRIYSLLVGQSAQVQPRQGPTLEPPSGLALPDKPSIAVLPFQNMSGDPEQEYFADGVVEEIITALSRIRWLFVIARNSSFTYKQQSVDARQVGRELGVRYLLEGSVRKAGGRVRITAQLIEAETGAHLWAERFDGSLEDVFELQDQVAISDSATASSNRWRKNKEIPLALCIEKRSRGLRRRKVSKCSSARSGLPNQFLSTPDQAQPWAKLGFSVKEPSTKPIAALMSSSK